MTPPTEFPAMASDPRAATNGQASLSERVKGLRLGTQLEGKKSGGGGSAWLPWTLCLLMGITWASFGIRAYTSGGLKGLLGQTPSTTAASAPGEGTKVQKPSTKAGPAAAPGELVLEVKGYMIAAHQIQVCPIEVSGRILTLAIEEGKQFKKGDVLAELDKTSYQADYDEAKGYLESAKAKLVETRDTYPIMVEQTRAQLKEANALLSQYESDYQRFDEIRKMNSGVAAKEFDVAKYSYFTQMAKVVQMEKALQMAEGPQKQRIAAAEGDLVQAQARFDRAKWRLDNCKIVAPVSGIILTKRAEIGNLVNALAMNTALNAGICDMADLTDLEVDLEIQERDISKIYVGQDCYVRADAYPNRRYQARVDRILPVANSSKAIIPIRVKVRVSREEEGKYLKPQMGAVVSFYNRMAPPETSQPPKPVVEE